MMAWPTDIAQPTPGAGIAAKQLWLARLARQLHAKQDNITKIIEMKHTIDVLKAQLAD